MSILLIVSYALFATSREILRGDVAVMKFRSVMGVLGFVLSASLLTTISFDDISSYLQAGICAVGLFLVLSDWFGNDDQRGLRKKFDARLNANWKREF